MGAQTMVGGPWSPDHGPCTMAHVQRPMYRGPVCGHHHCLEMGGPGALHHNLILCAGAVSGSHHVHAPRLKLNLACMCTLCNQKGHSADRCWKLAPVPPPPDRPPKLPPHQYFPPPHGHKIIHHGGLQPHNVLFPKRWYRLVVNMLAGYWQTT